MARSVAEWIGRSDDSTAPPAVKARIVLAQDGICACGCGQRLGAAGERIEFDHTTALILGGENREANLRALRSPCHGTKTKQDVAQKSVEARKRGKHLGLIRKKSVLPGSKTSQWKAKIGGSWVRRNGGLMPLKLTLLRGQFRHILQAVIVQSIICYAAIILLAWLALKFADAWIMAAIEKAGE